MPAKRLNHVTLEFVRSSGILELKLTYSGKKVERRVRNHALSATIKYINYRGSYHLTKSLTAVIDCLESRHSSRH